MIKLFKIAGDKELNIQDNAHLEAMWREGIRWDHPGSSKGVGSI